MTYKTTTKPQAGPGQQLLHRCLCVVCAVTLVLLGCFPLPVAANGNAAAPEGGDVLVLCPAQPGPALAAQIDALCETLTFMAKSYRCVEPEQAGSLKSWEYVILLLEKDMQLPDTLAGQLGSGQAPVLVIGAGGLGQLAATREATGVFTASYTFNGTQTLRWNSGEDTLRLLAAWDTDYGGKTGLLGSEETIPLCAGVGSIASIPWFDAEDQAMTMALADLLTQWMWPYQNDPWSYSAYLVLDRVFPFDDLEKLMALSDMLVEEGVPYAINAMPVYDNAHFPAMQRFCEYLCYAQSKGAAIVLHAPQAGLADTDAESMGERIELSYEAYVQYGVYPVALAAPTSWLYHEDGLALLKSTRTVLLFDTDEPTESLSQQNQAYSDGHTLIAPARNGQGPLYTRAYPTAVYLDVSQDTEDLRAIVRSYKSSSVPLRSLWSLPASLYIGTHNFYSQPGQGAWFDGQAASLQYKPFYYEDETDFRRGLLQFLTGQMEAGSQLILALVLGSGSLFLVLIVLARRRMRRQFLVKSPRQKKGDPYASG